MAELNIEPSVRAHKHHITAITRTSMHAIKSASGAVFYGEKEPVAVVIRTHRQCHVFVIDKSVDQDHIDQLISQIANC